MIFLDALCYEQAISSPLPLLPQHTHTHHTLTQTAISIICNSNVNYVADLHQHVHVTIFTIAYIFPCVLSHYIKICSSSFPKLFSMKIMEEYFYKSK